MAKNTKPLKHVIFTMIPNSNFPKSQTSIFNFPNSNQTPTLRSNPSPNPLQTPSFTTQHKLTRLQALAEPPRPSCTVSKAIGLALSRIGSVGFPVPESHPHGLGYRVFLFALECWDFVDQ
uniref:Uncharacterized protein n=1 Tax=Fagus sylvatica TaxID=28930 RepID=A0A2N9IJN8_FAGSY